MSRKGRSKKQAATHTPSVPENPRHAQILLAIALSCGLFLFTKNINDPFLIDDAAWIQAAMPFFPSNLIELLRPDMGTYWRPLGKLSFVLGAHLWKFNPVGYHLFSIALHLVTIGLVYLVAKRFLKNTWAAVAALIFALHPVHVGAVVWVSARFDLLATVFVLLACLFYLRSLVTIGNANTVAAIGFMVLGFFSKEIALTTPLFILIFAIFFGPSSTWINLTSRIKGVSAFFGVTLLYLALRVWVMGGIGGPGAHTGHPELFAPNWSLILSNFLRDFPLAHFLPINRAAWGNFAGGLSIIGLLLGGLLMAGFVWFRRRREPWVGLLFAMVAVLPISFFATIGANLESAYMLYLPSVGFSIFVAAIAYHAKKRGRIIGTVFMIGAALWMGTLVPHHIKHAQAFDEASKIGQAMRVGIYNAVKQTPNPGPIYCEGFIGRHKGVVLFFDEIEPLLWPVLKRERIGPVFLVNENLLIRNTALAPFRNNAQSDGFFYLQWARTHVSDRTAQAKDGLLHSEKSDTTERFFWEILDSDIQIWSETPPSLAVKPAGVVPTSSIDRLCLKLDLKPDDASLPIEYVLSWFNDSSAFTLRLPYAPTDDGYTCAALDRDPRWALGDPIIELYVTPSLPAGSAQLTKAEILYRTKVIEFEEEILIDGNGQISF